MKRAADEATVDCQSFTMEYVGPGLGGHPSSKALQVSEAQATQTTKAVYNHNQTSQES